MPAFGNVITLPKAGDFYNGGLWENSLPVVGFEWNLAPEFIQTIEIIEENLSLIGQEVEIISPKNSVALGYEMHNRKKCNRQVDVTFCQRFGRD